MQEIKTAIENLSPAERRELLVSLPALFPELDGDAAWERLTHDRRPRPALTAMLDQAEQAHLGDPISLVETSDAEFDRRS